MAGNVDWKKISNELDKIVNDITNTNICDAWDAIDRYIDMYPSL